MEFLTPKQKRAKSRRLFLGYGLLSLLTVLATYILVSTARGFELFNRNGEIIQNGLLFINSRPTDAEIYVNGTRESTTTNTKLSLPDNTYDIQLKKQGFRDWSKKVSVIGGSVNFLNYPRLLPTRLQEFARSPVTTSSPETLLSNDGRWLLAYTDSSPNVWSLFDLEKQGELKNFALPAGVLDNAPSSVRLIEWAPDNVRAMISVTQKEQTRYLIINRELPTEVVDINTSLNVAIPSRPYFWDGKWDQLVIRDSNNFIRTASLQDKSVSASPLIAEAVQEIHIYARDKIVYTTKIDTSTQAIWFKGAEKTVILSTTSYASPLIIDNVRFNQSDFILVAGGGLDKTYIFRNVLDSASKSVLGKPVPYVTLPIAATKAILSTTGRFIYAANLEENLTYDFERRELHRFTLPVQPVSSVGWLDDARLYFTNSGELYFTDFDGENAHKVADNMLGVPYVNKRVDTFAMLASKDSVHEMVILDLISPTE